MLLNPLEDTFIQFFQITKKHSVLVLRGFVSRGGAGGGGGGGLDAIAAAAARTYS